MAETKPTEGWGWPINSKRAHYFVGGRALCGRWLYTGKLDPEPASGPDDCAECKRRAAARVAQAAKGGM